MQGDSFHHFAAKLFRKFFHIDFVAGFFKGIDHIQGNNNRFSKLQNLGCKIKVSFNIRRINNVDYSRRFVRSKIIAGNNFFASIRRKRINSRKVGNNKVLVSFYFSFFFFNSYSRPVAYILDSSSKRIEHRGFSAVWISCKSNFCTHLLFLFFMNAPAPSARGIFRSL